MKRCRHHRSRVRIFLEAEWCSYCGAVREMERSETLRWRAWVPPSCSVGNQAALPFAARYPAHLPGTAAVSETDV